MPANTIEMSDSDIPLCRNWPRPSPSSGEVAISSAAISDRQENAQPCFRPPRNPGSAAGSRMYRIPPSRPAPSALPTRGRIGGTWSRPDTSPFAIDGTAPSSTTQ